MITSDDDDVDCQRMIFGPMLCGLIQGCCDNDRALTEIILKVNGGVFGDKTLVMVDIISSVVLGSDLAVENI